MIKNPTIGQTVFYFEGDKIRKGEINTIHKLGPKAVEISYFYYRLYKDIFPTEENAKKYLPKIYEEKLKTLNKEIFSLSKEREKLASKLAKLLEKR